MGIINRFKVWWKTTSTEEKLVCILGGTAVVVSGATSIACLSLCNNQMNKLRDDTIKAVKEDLNVDVSVSLRALPRGYSEGEDIPANPTIAGDAVDRSQYEMARDVYDLLEKYYEDGVSEDLDNAREKLLTLGWDLAILEHRMDDAYEGELPDQVFD